ncbi:DNA N-6-adenine-methyltransferase [Stenotrophomonas maltophilia]|uniref:DNA N-6-adenine-methyltransferase n=1 Tax=Stenotrophomonas maltophilia TaxID=40324 RepID=UPI00061AE5CC|nr:DNA N-6-adenine-methyltransferase [Stenotrophomonas maltophilia]MBA0435129.1 adenine methyltransferase [Stenotrophomonas maltophilia]MDJ1522270.1 phage N-6-adenine-methyltransferase [Stenotrophomonas maltophilia]
MQPKTNVVPFKTANRPNRLAAAKPTRLTSVCYKASDKAHTSVDWYTPPAIVRALGGRRGFDLDPCTPEDPSRLPAPTARRMIPPSQDGLATPWPMQAFVWMNPPYGKGMEKWLSKLANHPGGGIALVPVSMETGWMHEFVLSHPSVTGVLFTRGRLKFVRPDGSTGTAAPSGSLVVAYGKRAAGHLQQAQASGVLRGKFFAIERVVQVASANQGSANEE